MELVRSVIVAVAALRPSRIAFPLLSGALISGAACVALWHVRCVRLFYKDMLSCRRLDDAAVSSLTTRSYRPATLADESKPYDAVVIGAGIGGLSTASALSQMGWRVLVLEQHDRVGGATHVFESRRPLLPPPSLQLADGTEVREAAREGWDGLPESCEFDTGYHYTCGSFADVRSRAGGLLAYLCGRSCRWLHLGDPYDRVMFPQNPSQPANVGVNEYRFVRGKETLIDALTEQLTCHTRPDVVRDAVKRVLRGRIALFIKLSNDAARAAAKLFLIRAVPPLPFASLRAKMEDWGCRSIILYGRLSTAYVIRAVIGEGFTEHQVLSREPLPGGVSSEIDGTPGICEFPVDVLTGVPLRSHDDFKRAVRSVLTRAMAVCVHPVGDYGAQPRTASFLAHGFVVNYYRHGSSYPAESAQRISAGMVRQVLAAGGDCLCAANVTSIELDCNGARAIGVQVARSHSDGGTQRLIRARHVVSAAGIYHLYRGGGFLKGRPDLQARFEEQTFQPSGGHVYLFVVLEGTPEELGLEKTNLWCLRGSGVDHNAIDTAYDEFLDGNGGTPPAVYVTFPCAKHPAAWSAKYGHGASQRPISNAIVFCDAKYEWFAGWREGRPHYRGDDYEAMKRYFAEKLLSVLLEKRPDLRDRVLWHEVGTPVTSEYYLGAYHGADYGTKIDCEYFTPRSLQWLMRADTAVRNLWQSGQDAMTPSISGAMHGGLLCAMRMLGVLGSARLLLDIIAFKTAAIRRDAELADSEISWWRAWRSALTGGGRGAAY